MTKQAADESLNCLRLVVLYVIEKKSYQALWTQMDLLWTDNFVSNQQNQGSGAHDVVTL